jgi:hypothetical protein
VLQTPSDTNTCLAKHAIAKIYLSQTNSVNAQVKTIHTNKFKAVLFDSGPTLTKTADPPVIFKRILEAHGVTAPIQALDKAHKKNQEHLNVEEMAEKGLDFWIEWNTKIPQQVGIQENTHILARKIDELWFEHAEFELYPDVMETLTNLKAKNVKMGIVTGNSHKRIRKRLPKHLETIRANGFLGSHSRSRRVQKSKTPQRDIPLRRSQTSSTTGRNPLHRRFHII